ncbi:MAG: response regulator transcription factor [Henriciella sp.]
MKKIVFVIDDDEAVRHSLSYLLRQEGYIVRAFPDAKCFLDHIDDQNSGCLILDLKIPDIGGLSLQKKINRLGLNIPIIILTGYGDITLAVEAMKRGAIEFLEKPFRKNQLMNALKAGFDLIEQPASTRRLSAQAARKIRELTKRERQVLDCMIDGMTNKATAKALNISPRTVEVHRAHIMQKLGCKSFSATLRLTFIAEMEDTEFSDRLIW